jgi:hypothetical protein
MMILMGWIQQVRWETMGDGLNLLADRLWPGEGSQGSVRGRSLMSQRLLERGRSGLEFRQTALTAKADHAIL